MKLSVVVPVFNEEKTIARVVEKLLEVNFGKWEKEIIIVDDGSWDNTLFILRKYKNEVTIVWHDKNQGKTRALRTGLAKATGDYVIIQDGDLEYNPKDIPKMLLVAKAYPESIIYGSRFRGMYEDTVFGHKAANLFLTFLADILYGVTLSDVETCYKLIPRKFLDGIAIEGKRFDFEPEITAKLLKAGRQIIEVPISYHKRGFAQGKKIRWYDGVRAIWILLKLRFF